jgi:hypothetical protein
MGLWLGLTILLNVLSAVLIVVVFALVKKQTGLRQDILRIQKEWVQWRAMGLANHSSTQSASMDHIRLRPETEAPAAMGAYVSEHQIQEPAIEFSQTVRTRGMLGDDWGASGIREKAAKSLQSEVKAETLGETTDRFSKARELLRQGHGMKEVAVVTGLSYSELALLSKIETH